MIIKRIPKHWSRNIEFSYGRKTVESMDWIGSNLQHFVQEFTMTIDAYDLKYGFRINLDFTGVDADSIAVKWEHYLSQFVETVEV